MRAGAAEGGLLIWVVHGSQQCVCFQLFHSGLTSLELLHPLLQPVQSDQADISHQ